MGIILTKYSLLLFYEEASFLGEGYVSTYTKKHKDVYSTLEIAVQRNKEF